MGPSPARWFVTAHLTAVYLLSTLPTPLYALYQHELGFSRVVVTLIAVLGFYSALVPDRAGRPPTESRVAPDRPARGLGRGAARRYRADRRDVRPWLSHVPADRQRHRTRGPALGDGVDVRRRVFTAISILVIGVGLLAAATSLAVADIVFASLMALLSIAALVIELAIAE